MTDKIAEHNGILAELAADAAAIRAGTLDIDKGRVLNGMHRNRIRAAELLLQLQRLAKGGMSEPNVLELVAGKPSTNGAAGSDSA